MTEISVYFTVGVSLFYVLLFWLLAFIPKLTEKTLLLYINKVMLIFFSSFLYPAIISNLSEPLKANSENNLAEKITSGISLGLFQITICLQSYLSFGFVRNPNQWGTTRKSCLSVITFMIMVSTNILKDVIMDDSDDK